MKCEICKTIARLELDDSAHDLWYCADAPTGQFSLAHIKRFGRKVRAFFLLKQRQRRSWGLAHYRPRLVSLGILN
jgi:hypothetical protein